MEDDAMVGLGGTHGDGAGKSSSSRLAVHGYPRSHGNQGTACVGDMGQSSKSIEAVGRAATGPTLGSPSGKGGESMVAIHGLLDGHANTMAGGPGMVPEASFDSGVFRDEGGRAAGPDIAN